MSERGAPRRTYEAGGFTLVEAAVVVAVLGLLAAVTVPAAATAEARAAARSAACQFALVLREAQALAQAHGHVVAVRLGERNARYSVTETIDGQLVPVDSGCLSAVTWTTNYPQATVEFSAKGWPCSVVTHAPRAGTFTFGGGTHEVVVQLAGRIRWQ